MKTEDAKDSASSPEVREIPLPADGDNIAVKEVEAVDEESYDREAQRKEHTRTERFKDTLHVGALSVLAIAAVVLVAGIFVWSWHFLAPATLRWLTPEQIDDLHRMMSSALLAVFVREFSKKFFR